VLDVYLPPGGTAPYPTLLLIHGGGWQFGSKELMNSVASYFAARGFASVAPNYRLTPEFVHPAQAEDTFCALAWIHAHAERYGFDTTRIVTIGESAGGYLAALLGVTDDPNPYLTGCPHTIPADARLQAVVPYYPLLGASLDDYPYFTTLFMLPFVGAQPGQDDLLRERWPGVTPLNMVNGNEPPFLLIHGTMDDIVPANDSVQMQAALEAAGVPAQLVLLDDARHGFIGVLEEPAGLAAIEAVEKYLSDLNK
jgi:acetyl esterase/lipase